MNRTVRVAILTIGCAVMAGAQLPKRDSLVTYSAIAWKPQPLSLVLSPNGKTVLTITPDGKFELGPGATADSAARAIVALAEQYVKWKTDTIIRVYGDTVPWVVCYRGSTNATLLSCIRGGPIKVKP